MISRELSHDFQVAGYVRNLPDGTVELEAEGEPAEVDRFLAAIASEFKHNIANADIRALPPGGGEGAFRITYWCGAVPEGRVIVAQGGSPGVCGRLRTRSPGGATEIRAALVLFRRPSGAHYVQACDNRGLAPPATDRRPSGAENVGLRG
jgi:acylphosphatase